MTGFLLLGIAMYLALPIFAYFMGRTDEEIKWQKKTGELFNSGKKI